MCDVCRRTPCDPRCPNAPDPIGIYTCDRCGEAICEGDTFIEEPDGDILCGGCLDNMTTDELLSEFGIVVQTAERDDPLC